MKNRIICISLCIFALAASVILLVNVINRDAYVKNPNTETVDKDNETPPPPSFDSESVELTDKGVASFAARVESFIVRLAYENDKSYESEAQYIITNANSISEWMSEKDPDGAAYYKLISDTFDTLLKNTRTDAEFSAFAGETLRKIDAAYSGLDNKAKLFPELDTTVGGSMTLALLSVNDAVYEKSLDPSKTFTVTVGGSVLLGDEIGTPDASSFRKAYESSKYSFPFYKLSPFFANDDATFITLTAPLTESTEANANQLAPVKGLPDYASSLFGINAVSLSPASVLDYNEQGYKDTVDALKKNGISSSQHEGAEFIDTEFGKVVYITYDLTGTEVSDSQKSKNVDIISRAVQNERENGANLIIVQLHWNTRERVSSTSSDYVGEKTKEYNVSVYEPHFDAYNKDIARAAIKAGADLVVGTGTHVAQGVELYEGKYIVYSQGDLVYTGKLDSDVANTAFTFLFRQTFEKTSNGVKVLSTRIVPVVNNSESSRFCPTPVFDASADSIVDTLVYQSHWFTNAIKSFNYIKIDK